MATRLKSRVLLVFLCLQICMLSQAAAQISTNRASHANLAHGSEIPLYGGLPRPSVLPAWQDLKRNADGKLRVSWHPDTGTPEAIYGHMGRVEDGVSMEMAARAFVGQHLQLFRMTSPDELIMTSLAQTSAGTHILFQQVLRGIPVYGATMGIHINHEGWVYALTNEWLPNVDLAVTTPTILPEDAVARMIATLTATLPTWEPAGAQYQQLVVLPVDRGVRLAWHVRVAAKNSVKLWEAFWDAQTGAQLTPIVDCAYHTDGQGKVFIPNPIAALGIDTLRDQDDRADAVPANAYTTVLLPRLDGSGFVNGLHANTSLTPNRISDPLNDFTALNRHDAGFEEVEAYWAIDFAQSYVQQILGITNAANYSIPLNVHASADDNSAYEPGGGGQGSILFGDGGVDDAEDAEVIWHEYGHAILDNQRAGLLDQNFDGMGEGFGDYWAATLSSMVASANHAKYDPALMEWDASAGGGSPPSLRRVDLNLHYPEDRSTDPHVTGEIWSGALWEIQNVIGRDVGNAIFFQGNVLLPNAPTLPVAAAAMLQASDEINNGAATPAMLSIFIKRGLVLTASYPSEDAPNAHHVEGGTRAFPNFPDGTPVQINPGELQRIRFLQPALVDKPTHLFLTFKAGAPSTWEFTATIVQRDGTQARTVLTRSQGTWMFDADFGVTQSQAIIPTEVQEVYLDVRDLRRSGNPRGYSFTGDIIPVFRDAYVPDLGRGTTATVRNLLSSNNLNQGTVVKLEVTMSAPVTDLSADFSQPDTSFDPTKVEVSTPTDTPSGAIYTVAYPLSYSTTASTGAVRMIAGTTINSTPTVTTDTSFSLAIGGQWTYVWDGAQAPDQAGWVREGSGRLTSDFPSLGLFHFKVTGSTSDFVAYTFHAGFLQNPPFTIEFRARNIGFASQVGSYQGAVKEFAMTELVSSTIDVIGLDFVVEPFPPGDFNNIFMDTKDTLHIYRLTLDAGGVVSLYVDSALRLQALADNTGLQSNLFNIASFVGYEGIFDYIAFKGGAASDPSILPSPPTAP